MSAEVKVRVDCETTNVSTSDSTKSGSISSKGKLTRTMSASSADKYPVHKAFGEAELKEGITGYNFDGTSGLDLSSTYTKPANNTGGFILIWSKCTDYTNKHFLNGGTNGGYLKFVDASTLEYKSGGSKGATTTIRLNDTAGTTTSYTYGTTDVEALIWTVNTSNNVQIWNVNGDRIFNAIVAGAYGGQFVYQHILHDSSFAGPSLTLLDLIVYEDHQITASDAATIASGANSLKN